MIILCKEPLPSNINQLANVDQATSVQHRERGNQLRNSQDKVSGSRKAELRQLLYTKVKIGHFYSSGVNSSLVVAVVARTVGAGAEKEK